MEGSIVNQIEISGFTDEKEMNSFRKKIKSLHSVFNLSKLDKSLSFVAEEASWKINENKSLLFLFITEDITPSAEIARVSKLFSNLTIRHLAISPSKEGEMVYSQYLNGSSEDHQVSGPIVNMLGDLLKGGFN